MDISHWSTSTYMASFSGTPLHIWLEAKLIHRSCHDFAKYAGVQLLCNYVCRFNKDTDDPDFQLVKLEVHP